jgi:amino acid permease
MKLTYDGVPNSLSNSEGLASSVVGNGRMGGQYDNDGDELAPIHVGVPSSFDIDAPYGDEVRHVPHAQWYHAAFHSVCAVVGAGVLGLPYAFRYLGWIGGLFSLTVLFCVSLYTSYILSELHEDGNVRLNTYREIGQYVWGETRGWWAVAPVQFTLMAGLCITYSVTAGQSMKGIASSDCSGADCQDGIGAWIVLFGILQVFLSQVPDFHSLWWVSLLGGVMSIGYCTIAAGGSIAAAVQGTDDVDGAMTNTTSSTADDVFGVMNALGSVAFTFGGQAVVPEIQATLAVPPRSSLSMMKAIGVSYIVVFLTYYSVGISGYAAFGAAVEPDILLSIKKPQVLVDIADVMVVLHVAAGYQVFAMPLFDVFEDFVRSKLSKRPRPVVLRLCVRTLFVFFTTFIAILVPFFDDLMGLIASIGLMPITFILPPLLWISSRRPTGIELWVNVVIAAGSSLLALVAFVGSARNMIHDASAYDAFSN